MSIRKGHGNKGGEKFRVEVLRFPPGRGVTDTITDNSRDALPRVIPLNPPNRDNHPHFTSKLRLREVNRVTDSNFPGTVPLFTTENPTSQAPLCLRQARMFGHLRGK